jgi:nitroimidazol reductase NimA-like FMN-containing flavoprotein (pyridoxamine 5'-phosphate oxidase superfamily)
MIERQEATANAFAFLQDTVTGVLGTVSTSGIPHTSTVYFSYTDDFSIYFIVSHHSEKFKNLTLNPLASFTVGAGPTYREVTIRGKVELISDSHLRIAKTAEIAARVDSPIRDWPVFKVTSLENGGTALFKIVPSSVHYLDLESVTNADDLTTHIFQLLP